MRKARTFTRYGEVKCAVCEKFYIKKHSNHFYCSIDCKKTAQRKRERKPYNIKVCPICGSSFEAVGAGVFFYCSDKCRKVAKQISCKLFYEKNRKNPYHLCANGCGHYTHKLYCSFCKGKSKNRHPFSQKRKHVILPHMPSKLIKSKQRVREFGEVYTPSHIVKDMVDLCEPTISQIDANILEPSCGNGNFLVEILQRKLKNCKTDTDILKAAGSLFGVDLLADNVEECIKRLLNMIPLHLWGTADQVFRTNIIQGDFLKPETIWFLKD